jgi:putative oxidoreductase
MEERADMLKTPRGRLWMRLAGLAAAPVLIGAIVMVHAPRWSFVPTESHPLGGMEFQVALLGIALFFLLTGGLSKEVHHG